ncbi:MAG: hypothetical protein ACREJD_07815 [Phycisphaerales bacterium]
MRNPWKVSRTSGTVLSVFAFGACAQIAAASTPPTVMVLGPSDVNALYAGSADGERTPGIYLAKQNANRVAWGHQGASPNDDLSIRVWTRSNQTIETVAMDLSLNAGYKLQLAGMSGDGEVIVGTSWSPDPPYNDTVKPFTWQFGNDGDDLNTDFDANMTFVPVRGGGANADGSIIGIQASTSVFPLASPTAHLYEVGSSIASLTDSFTAFSGPYALNADNSIVVGFRQCSNELRPGFARNECRTCQGGGGAPFIWDEANGAGYVSDSGTVPEGVATGVSWVTGRAVGRIDHLFGISDALVWSRGFRTTGERNACNDFECEPLWPLYLDITDGAVWSEANDIGTHFAVGSTSNGFFPDAPAISGGNQHAVWWDENAVGYDLNEVFNCFMPNTSNYELRLVSATSITNDDRAIAGKAVERSREDEFHSWSSWKPVAWLAQLESCPGDLDYDGDVDGDDFEIFADSYNNVVCGLAGCCLPGDLDWNRQVDTADFALFVSAYNDVLCP